MTPRDFQPAAWLPGPHLPTIWASVCRRVPMPEVEPERVELPDGDFLDIALTRREHRPWVLILHGLEGSIESSYARALLSGLDTAGMRGVLMHFRGCSGTLNRLPRSYHSGDTADLDFIVRMLTTRWQNPPLAVVGYSLGGNVTLKWLAEQGEDAPATTAVAISVPFDLAACADRLDEGFSRVYQKRLVDSMFSKYRRKFAGGGGPESVDEARRLRTFWAYDDRITAPLHGFKNADDYYTRSSSRRYLHAIRQPTLILHALDDPFVPARAIPRADELSPRVTLELCERGGHVGFVTGTTPNAARYWAEERILRHLRDTYESTESSGSERP